MSKIFNCADIEWITQFISNRMKKNKFWKKIFNIKNLHWQVNTLKLSFSSFFPILQFLNLMHWSLCFFNAKRMIFVFVFSFMKSVICFYCFQKQTFLCRVIALHFFCSQSKKFRFYWKTGKSNYVIRFFLEWQKTKLLKFEFLIFFPSIWHTISKSARQVWFELQWQLKLIKI